MSGEFVKVAVLDDLSPGKLVVVKLQGREVCLVRSGGSVVALSAICTHQGCNLGDDGEVDGNELECACHGSRFELATGRVTSGPARQPLQRYEVKTEGRDVLISVS